jgi:hypothetical protein
MTRFLAATAILVFLAFSSSNPAHAENRSVATDNGCFPWQDYKNGQCVAKPSQAPPPTLPDPGSAPAVTPPAPPPLTAVPAPPVVCLDGTTNVGGQCTCPANTHADAASGRCVADISTRRPSQAAIVCNGGTVANGACTCPQGFDLMPAGDAEGGTCARANADNCLGGEMTADGKCICNGQVTMDGETYLLEYTNGKCLPMRCPVTALHDGKCGAATTTAQPKNDADEDEHRRRCGRGMVMTRSGCVAARRRQDMEGSARQYYRNLYPGSVTPPF